MDIEKEEKLTLIKHGYRLGKLYPHLVGSVKFNFFKGGLSSIQIINTMKPEEVTAIGTNKENN